MEAKSTARLSGRTRRELSQERVAYGSLSAPEQGYVCELSAVLEEAPAHARVGLALWLVDTAARDAHRSDPEMNPQRFPQRRSTRLMIPHTAGNSDRVLFSLRLPEPGTTPAEGASTAEGPSTAHNNESSQRDPHVERRARRLPPSDLSPCEEGATDFTGVPAPAWIVHQAEPAPE